MAAYPTKTLFGSFATFLGASPDDAGGAELGWLLASVLQNAGNNLVKGGMHRVTLALAEDLRAHGGEIRTNTVAERILGDAKRATDVRLTSEEEIPEGELIHSPVDISRKIISAVRGTLGQGAFLPYQSGSFRRFPSLANTKRLCLMFTSAVPAVIPAQVFPWPQEEMRRR